MKSLAFIVVGVALGILLTFLFLNPNSNFLTKPNKTEEPQVSETKKEEAKPSQTPELKGTSVEAGGKLSFPKYEITVPSAWSFSKASGGNDETLVISKNKYEITINQIASEGSICVYPGDPEPEIPFVANYEYFKELTLSDGTKLRRSGESATASNYTLCGYSQENYQLPTIFGYISVKTPVAPSPSDLNEVDQILSSLKTN